MSRLEISWPQIRPKAASYLRVRVRVRVRVRARDRERAGVRARARARAALLPDLLVELPVATQLIVS